MELQTFNGLFRGLPNHNTVLALSAVILLVGCTNIPKGQLKSLRAHSPNVPQVRRSSVQGGVLAKGQIRETPDISLKLDSAQTLNGLLASTNLARFDLSSTPIVGQQMKLHPTCVEGVQK